MVKRQKPLLAEEASPNYRVVPPGERIYVDTSVWVALLAREAPAAALSLWLAQAPPLCCANWAELELASALGIKHRRGELSLAAARSICDVFASMMVYQVQQAPVHAADVTLMRSDPLLVPDAIAISRATYAKIRQGLFWAFVYNVVGMPVAAFGLLDPVYAGAAMALSSVSVVANALLLRRWKPALAH